MRRRLRIPRPSLGLLALLVFIVSSATARAQLFPDLNIRRQRPCCDAEDPRYRVIREQYYGYYPTCWRRFPPGWGCPSPEAPNWEKAKLDPPLQSLESLGAGGGGASGLRRNDRPGGNDVAPVAPRLPEIPDNIDGGDLFNVTPAQPGTDTERPPTGIEPARPGLFDLPPGGSDPGAATPESAVPAPGVPDLAAPNLGSTTGLPAAPSDVVSLAPPLGVGEQPVDLSLDLTRDLPQPPPLSAPPMLSPEGLPPGALSGAVTLGAPEFGQPIPGLDAAPGFRGQPIPGHEHVAGPHPADEPKAARRGPIANLLGRMRKR